MAIPTNRVVRQVQGKIEEINSLEPEFESRTDEGLEKVTDELNVRFAKGLVNWVLEKAKHSETNLKALSAEEIDAVVDKLRSRLKGRESLKDAILGAFAEVRKDINEDRLRNTLDYYKEVLEEVADAVLNGLLPKAFAAVREAAKRTLGQRHYDVQLIGGVVLHEGKIAEMRTGEGKTLVATLPSYLNALTGEGVHVVTVNDYLARRDAQWMGAVYHMLGLSVGVLQNQSAYIYDPDPPSPKAGMERLRVASRSEAYAADITYGTNNEFGFDFLRDNMVVDLPSRVQRGRVYGIVDEVDNILIDEARTPLIISGQADTQPREYHRFAKLVHQLRESEDYTIDEKHKAVSLTVEGMAKLEQVLGVSNLYDPSNFEIVHFVENAVKAQAIYKRDRDYVVKDGEVMLVDEFTGRLMPGRRVSDGLHQALEAKEGTRVQRETITHATITLQNYFRLYEKLAGMTGTAATEAEEFFKIYKLEVVEIPTHRPMVREDSNDVIYRDQKAKYKAVVNDIKTRHESDQPVLVGTTDISKSEALSGFLKRQGIPHEVLNAKQHEREAMIVAQAGKPGAVTVATNMAGRGTDIILGGSLDGLDESEWSREHQRVLDAGGLHIIGTERHEARRIDNQLRGRSGRQGDPGTSRYYVALDDDLMRRFGGDRIRVGHGLGGNGRRCAHREPRYQQVTGECAGQSRGAPLRHAEAPGGLRRCCEHPQGCYLQRERQDTQRL